MNFNTLILSLPTGNATLRMRAWRTLKTVGAASLADGVHLLPERPDCRDVVERIAADVRAGEGTAHILDVVREPADTFTEFAFCDLPPRETQRAKLKSQGKLRVGFTAGFDHAQIVNGQ